MLLGSCCKQPFLLCSCSEQVFFFLLLPFLASCIYFGAAASALASSLVLICAADLVLLQECVTKDIFSLFLLQWPRMALSCLVTSS
jgi:hypothetical protein